MWNRLFSAAPVRSSRISARSTSASPFTGAIEMRLTDGTSPRLRARLDLDLVPFELEDVAVATGNGDGGGGNRLRPDCAFETAAVGVAVQDDVGTVLRDRRCE